MRRRLPCVIRQDANRGRPIADDVREYIPKHYVETMSYGEIDAPPAEAVIQPQAVRHCNVTEDEAGQRLDNFVRRQLGDLPRSRIYRVIRKGEVRVNGHRAGPDSRLKVNDKVRMPPVRMQAEPKVSGPASSLLERVAAAIIPPGRASAGAGQARRASRSMAAVV